MRMILCPVVSTAWPFDSKPLLNLSVALCRHARLLTTLTYYFQSFIASAQSRHALYRQFSPSVGRMRFRMLVGAGGARSRTTSTGLSATENFSEKPPRQSSSSRPKTAAAVPTSVPLSPVLKPTTATGSGANLTSPVVPSDARSAATTVHEDDMTGPVPSTQWQAAVNAKPGLRHTRSAVSFGVASWRASAPTTASTATTATPETRADTSSSHGSLKEEGGLTLELRDLQTIAEPTIADKFKIFESLARSDISVPYDQADMLWHKAALILSAAARADPEDRAIAKNLTFAKRERSQAAKLRESRLSKQAVHDMLHVFDEAVRNVGSEGINVSSSTAVKLLAGNHVRQNKPEQHRSHRSNTNVRGHGAAMRGSATLPTLPTVRTASDTPPRPARSPIPTGGRRSERADRDITSRLRVEAQPSASAESSAAPSSDTNRMYSVLDDDRWLADSNAQADGWDSTEDAGASFSFTSPMSSMTDDSDNLEPKGTARRRRRRRKRMMGSRSHRSQPSADVSIADSMSSPSPAPLGSRSSAAPADDGGDEFPQLGPATQ